MNLDPQIIEKFKGEAVSAEKEIVLKVKAALEDKIHSKRRWFWELMQNAIDTISTSNDKTNLELTVRISNGDEGKTVSFSHNGGVFKKSKKLFRFDDFKNLINPVSGKSAVDSSTIGKFGTGFLSTHILSLKVKVEGKFEKEEFHPHINISALIDRTKFLEISEEARNERIYSIIESLSEIEKNFDSSNSLTYPNTRFTYYLKHPSLTDLKDDLEVVKYGLDEIENSIAFVLSFNRKVKKISIVDEISVSRSSSYEMNYDISNDLGVTKNQLVRNNIPLNKFVIVCEDDDVSIAWEIDEKNNFADLRERNQEEFCGLYCTFPLLGSEAFKFPMIIHSKNFKPNEKRNGIQLTDINSSNCAKISRAIDLFKKNILDKSDKYESLYNIIVLSNLNQNIEWADGSWLNQTIKDLRNKILRANLVTVHNSQNKRLSIIDNSTNINRIFFPNYLKADGTLDSENNSEFYDLCLPFYKDQLPKKEDLNFWLKNLWFDEQIKRIKLEDLLDRIIVSSSVDALLEKFHFQEDTEVAKKYQVIEEYLSKLYNFIFKVNRKELLNHSKNTNHEIGIILTKGGKLKRFVDCKKDIGFNNMPIDDEFLVIHQEMCQGLVKDFLISTKFQNLINESNLEIREENLARDIRAKAEEFLMKEHDNLLGKKSNNQELTENENKRLIEIEKQLSKLQIWISKYNQDRKYFKDYFKRKLLQSIIDEKKSISLMNLIELDRSDVISLERQIQILRDPDLELKIQLGEEVLAEKEKKRKEFQRNLASGEIFENLFKKLMSQFSFLSIKKVDGEQDYVITNNQNSNNNTFYIEIKSISSSASNIELTPAQAKKAAKYSDNYFLCVVPHTGVQMDESIFKLNARFDSIIGKKLMGKVHLIEQLEKSSNGINVNYEDNFLKQYNKYRYKFEVDKSTWGIEDFNKFIERIKK